ncbi:MAG: FAD-dependent oxidoreductase [Patescibacteria group bacterium]|nr:FAD-dependent oxidoreductase [Patescibacteria group bacterium]
MYDVAIIGGGPAGCAAAVYAARKLLKTLLITESFGGQSIVSSEVQNWIGTEKVTGPELAKMLERHVRSYARDVVDIVKGERIEKITSEGHFVLMAKSGKRFDAKTVLVASGGDRKKLDVPGAKEFDQKGLTYCASCDGPLFAGMDVAVIGGGNAGFETAAQLLSYTKSVTLLQRGETFTADPVTVAAVLAHPQMRAITQAETKKIYGDKFVTGLAYSAAGGTETDLSVAGIFVEIGLVASTGFVKGLVDMDQYQRIIVDPKNQMTTCEGIWAAGDCTNGLYHQNNIAAGDAVKAIEDIFVYLATR